MIDRAFVTEFLAEAMESDQHFKESWEQARYAVWNFRRRVANGQMVTAHMLQRYRNHCFIVMSLEKGAQYGIQ